MESINNALNKLSKGRDFNQRFAQLKQQVYQNEDIMLFLSNHPELSEDAVNRSMPKLFEYMNQSKNCASCSSLEHCCNMIKGYTPLLFVDKGLIDVHYEKCSNKLKAEQRKKQLKLFQGMYIPKEIRNAKMNLLHSNQDERTDAIEHAIRFYQSFQESETSVGLYFHGGFGVGKSYIMAAIANKLAEEKNVQSLMVYTPDFFRDMKSAIQDQSVNEKLDYIKKIPLLILDDIGAETVTSWVRDDLLGSILQYRMMEKLPTMYTSNYDYDELENHLSYSQKSGTERLKAKRIMERIRHLTTAVEIGGENQRSRT